MKANKRKKSQVVTYDKDVQFSHDQNDDKPYIPQEVVQVCQYM